MRKKTRDAFVASFRFPIALLVAVVKCVCPRGVVDEVQEAAKEKAMIAMMHWDDDDWFSKDSLRVKRRETTRRAVTFRTCSIDRSRLLAFPFDDSSHLMILPVRFVSVCVCVCSERCVSQAVPERRPSSARPAREGRASGPQRAPEQLARGVGSER